MRWRSYLFAQLNMSEQAIYNQRYKTLKTISKSKKIHHKIINRRIIQEENKRDLCSLQFEIEF